MRGVFVEIRVINEFPALNSLTKKTFNINFCFVLFLFKKEKNEKRDALVRNTFDPLRKNNPTYSQKKY